MVCHQNASVSAYNTECMIWSNREIKHRGKREIQVERFSK